MTLVITGLPAGTHTACSTAAVVTALQAHTIGRALRGAVALCIADLASAAGAATAAATI